MQKSNSDEFEALLRQCRKGDSGACEQIFSRIYTELRRMAARYLKDERPGHTLQPTALVNEVLLKVLDKKATNWENRSHLLGSMAIQMRHILIDYARRRQSHKRIQIELPGDGRQPRFEELLGVHEALERLAAKNPLRADIAVRRVFVGMTIAEIAEELGISEATVKLEWDYTKSWLRFQFRN